jgi:hypothetical protein
LENDWSVETYKLSKNNGDSVENIFPSKKINFLQLNKKLPIIFERGNYFKKTGVTFLISIFFFFMLYLCLSGIIVVQTFDRTAATRLFYLVTKAMTVSLLKGCFGIINKKKIVGEIKIC